MRELADALLGASREPLLLEAAREAAEAVIHLFRVQRWRRVTLEGSALAEVATSDAALDAALELSRAVKFDPADEFQCQTEALRAVCSGGGSIEPACAAALIGQLRSPIDDLRRLSEYERRDLSRRRNALRRLDYKRVEAERRAARQRR